MGFTAILGMLFRGVTDNSSPQNVPRHVLQSRVRATEALLGVDSQAVQGPQTPTLAQPLRKLGSSLGPGSSTCRAQCYSLFQSLCAHGGVCIWSQGSTPAVSANREPWKARRWWCPIAQVSGKGQIMVWLNSGHFTGIKRCVWICARKGSCLYSHIMLTLDITIHGLLQCTPKLIPI